MKSVPTSSVQWKSASSLLAKQTLENPQFLSTSGNTKRSRTGEATLPGAWQWQLTPDIGMEGGRGGAVAAHTATATATSCHRCSSLTGGKVAPGSRNLFIAPNRNNILKVEAFCWRPLTPDGRPNRPLTSSGNQTACQHSALCSLSPVCFIWIQFETKRNCAVDWLGWAGARTTRSPCWSSARTSGRWRPSCRPGTRGTRWGSKLTLIMHYNRIDRFFVTSI